MTQVLLAANSRADLESRCDIVGGNSASVLHREPY